MRYFGDLRMFVPDGKHSPTREEFEKANKDFEWLIYPDKNHGITGGNTRLHLYNKMTKFVEDNLYFIQTCASL